MAKAKKSEPGKTETKAEKTAPPAASKAKKAPTGKKPATQSSGHPMIDTTFAASAAAKMLAAGANKSGPTPNASATRSESAMFKNLKAGLNKPSSTTMSNLLDKSHGPEPTKSHAGFNKQVGHNQTYGADVTRSGVPRRMPG